MKCIETIETKTKKWGSSIGIIIPKDIVKRAHIKEGQKVEIILRKPSNIDMDNVFGSLKNWKKSTDKILKNVDKELWHD